MKDVDMQAGEAEPPAAAPAKADLASRLAAVFGNLGGEEKGGWSINQQVAPFQSGRDVEDYDYSTDDEEGGKSSVAPPVMPTQLIDSDREEEEEEWDEGGAGTAAEKLQVTTCLRRAFEEEEEEDCYDRMAAAGVTLKLDPESGELTLASDTTSGGCRGAAGGSGAAHSCVVMEDGEEDGAGAEAGAAASDSCSSMARALRGRKHASGSSARGKPTGSTEVLEGNVFDRLCELRAKHTDQTDLPTTATPATPATAAAAAAMARAALAAATATATPAVHTSQHLPSTGSSQGAATPAAVPVVRQQQHQTGQAVACSMEVEGLAAVAASPALLSEGSAQGVKRGRHGDRRRVSWNQSLLQPSAAEADRNSLVAGAASAAPASAPQPHATAPTIPPATHGNPASSSPPTPPVAAAAAAAAAAAQPTGPPQQSSRSLFDAAVGNLHKQAVVAGGGGGGDARQHPGSDGGGGGGGGSGCGAEPGARCEGQTAGSGGGAAAAGGGGSSGRGRSGVRLEWQQRGFVPDHVRNPNRYTVYSFDESLVVGGGEKAAASQHVDDSTEAAAPAYIPAAHRATAATSPQTIPARPDVSSMESLDTEQPSVLSGPGAVKFISRQHKAAANATDGSSHDTAMHTAADVAASSRSSQQQQQQQQQLPRVTLGSSYDDADDGEEGGGGGGGGGGRGGTGSGAGSVGMASGGSASVAQELVAGLAVTGGGVGKAGRRQLRSKVVEND
ncbi:MAG: hypothetical protein WDW38_003504 [Sanguina aurantia]